MAGARDRDARLPVPLAPRLALGQELDTRDLALALAAQRKEDVARGEGVADVGQRELWDVGSDRVVVVVLAVRLDRRTHASGARVADARHEVVGLERHEGTVLVEGRQEQEERLLVVAPVAAAPGPAIVEGVADAGPRADLGRREVVVVIQARAVGHIQLRRDALGGLEVDASLRRGETAGQLEWRKARVLHVRAVVAVGRRGVVVDVEELVAAARLQLERPPERGRQIVLERRLLLTGVLAEDDRAGRDHVLRRDVGRHDAVEGEVLDLLVHAGRGIRDAEQPHRTLPEQPLPVDARRRTLPLVADVEGVDLVFDVLGVVRPAKANVVETGDIDDPDAILGRQVVQGLGVDRVERRHAAEAHVVREHVENAATGRDDPRPALAGQRSLDDAARAREAEGGAPAEVVAAALALSNLEHAGGAVDVGRRIAPGQERHVLDQIGVQDAHRAAGRREVREGVDVRNLDVVDDEEVLEGTAAAHDDVVAEVVGPDDHARKVLHVARHVLQGRRTGEDLGLLDEERGGLDLLGRHERRCGDRHRLGQPLERRQRHLDTALEARTHIHRVALDRRRTGGGDLQAVGASAHVRNLEPAVGAGHCALRRLDDADRDIGRRGPALPGNRADDGTDPGGVLREGGGGGKEERREEEQRPDKCRARLEHARRTPAARLRMARTQGVDSR